MKRDWRLTRRAERQLKDIASWTQKTFGEAQAQLYETEILDRCEAIADGRAHVRSCAQLVDGAQNLGYTTAGEHFVIIVETTDVVVIAAFIHSRSDIPAKLMEIMRH